MKSFSIGIDLGGTNLKGAVMDKDGKTRHITRIPTEAQKGGATVLANLLRLVEMLIEKEGGTDMIAGVGFGTPGFVDRDGMILGGAENLPGWKGTRVYDAIRERCGLAAAGANDVTIAALAESRFGAGRGVENMVCLALGTGIGGGIVINGCLYEGTHGMAGELGHIVVQTGGAPCPCGMRGCVEQYASATAIVRIAKELAPNYVESSKFAKEVILHPDRVTAKIVYDQVKKSDPLALQVNETVCEKLAIGIGIILNSLSPDRIVLGGGVMMAGHVIIDTVTKYVSQNCWPQIAQRCQIVAAELGEDAGLLGAGALVFDRIHGAC
jgi:glucokinase